MTNFKLPTEKSPDPDPPDFTSAFTKHFKKNNSDSSEII